MILETSKQLPVSYLRIVLLNEWLLFNRHKVIEECYDLLGLDLLKQDIIEAQDCINKGIGNARELEEFKKFIENTKEFLRNEKAQDS